MPQKPTTIYKSYMAVGLQLSLKSDLFQRRGLVVSSFEKFRDMHIYANALAVLGQKETGGDTLG